MLNLLPLSQLLALRQDDYPIAWLAGRPLTLQQLRRDVAALSHWLQAQPGSPLGPLLSGELPLHRGPAGLRPCWMSHRAARP